MPAPLICPPQGTPLSAPTTPDGQPLTDTDWYMYWYNMGQAVANTPAASGGDFPFVTPEQFGAIGNGSTDDSRAWTATIAASIAQNKPILARSVAYRVSKQGTAVLPWDGLSHGYVFKVTSPIVLLGHPSFLVDVTDANVANVFLFQSTSGVRIMGIKCTGIGTPASLKLYSGALFAFDRCSNCFIYDSSTTNMRGNATFFQSNDCEVQAGFSSIPTTNFAGSHFASYGCSRVTIRDCVSYAGTFDSDITHFGTLANNRATGNRILNCSAYNYAFGDATKAIVSNTAQGLTMDSGQEFGEVADCYAYGYFYGIDIKTTCSAIIVRNNTVEKCKVGIAVRRGEGAAPLYDTQVLGNVIRPLGGNGNTQNLFSGLTNTVGIWLQDARGATVANNLIEASWLFGSGEQDYIAIFGVTTSSFPPLDSANDGFLITGNKFINEMNISGFYTYTKNATIYLVGLSNNLLMRGKIDGNDFKSFTGGNVTLNTITVQYCSQFSISNNHFGRIVGNYQAVIVANATQLQVNDNTFAGAAGFISITTADSITVQGNHFGIAGRNLGTALPVPIIFGSTVTHITIDGNVQDQTINGNASVDDGRFFETSAAGNADIVISSNVMEKKIFIVDWYQINAISLNTSPGIAVVGNVLNGTTVAGTALAPPVTVPQGGTGDTTLTAHGVLVGEGVAAVGQTAAGASGRPLIGQGAADPKFLGGGDTLDLTGAATVAPNSAAGYTANIVVRNATGTGTNTITVSGGLITNFV